MKLVELVAEVVPGFVPDETTLYTARYAFSQKDGDDVKHFFRHFVGLWLEHEKMFANIVSSESVLSCLFEYLGEFDSSFVGTVVPLKKEVSK